MQSLRVRGTLTAVASAALVGALAAPGAAATSLTIDGVTRSGSVLSVTGRATYANQPFVTLGTDPAGDAVAPGVEFTGKDVTAFSVATNTTGSVTLRWHLSQLPPALNRGVDVGYGKAFCITPSTEEPNCWVVIFVDVAGAPLTNSFVQGWRCSDETCAIASGDWIHTWETDQYDATAKTASATIPPADLGITPGSQLRAVSSANFVGSVFVTTPWWFLSIAGVYPTYDGTTIGADYTVPVKDVSLAIDAPGQTPENVAYSAAATVADDGGYIGNLDVSGLAPGAYTVYARACFGASNCGYATTQVTL